MCQYHAGTYICRCLSGFMGDFCEEKITGENIKTRYALYMKYFKIYGLNVISYNT